MAATQKQPVTGAGPFNGVLTWVDQRFPLIQLWKDHLSEYYVPKNFNFWYYFGSLAMVVLVLQIVTGIFLTMHYKPDAALAFASVEYIMRDVPGNSGGALVDVNGNLIGINTAIYSRTPGGASLGIGFAIPVSAARQVMEQLVKTGTVTRGWIGVGAQDMARELAESFKLPQVGGAMISEVLRGGPADKAGIKPGDVLIAVNGQPVNDSAGMLALIVALPPGQQATLKVLRGQTEAEIKITIGKRPKQSRQEE